MRVDKHGWYVSNDPDNALTDNYQHMLDAKGRFSGSSLKFKSIPSDFAYDLN